MLRRLQLLGFMVITVACGGCKNGSQPSNTPVDSQIRDFWNTKREERLHDNATVKYDPSIIERDLNAPSDY
jgi:hypothetical protein